jgi:hypothetical protein
MWDHVYSISKFNPDLVIRLKDKDPDVKLKNIPEREYDLFSNGFFGRKEAENYDKQFFK